MAKAKVFEDKSRRRKLSQKTEETKHMGNSFNPQQHNKFTSEPRYSAMEKTRMRKPHRRHQPRFFIEFSKEFSKRFATIVVIAILFVVLLHFGVQRYYLLKYQRHVYTPIALPRLVAPNETSPENSPELFWGTYRPGIFFGMSHRSPHSMHFGLVWAILGTASPKLRHECSNDKSLKSYNWIEHDGRHFGIQTIIDLDYNITISFIKRPSIPYGGDWTARITVSSTSGIIKQRPVAFMFYSYLPDSTRGMIQSFTHGNEMKRLRGFTHELGAFQVNFHTYKTKGGRVVHQSHLSGFCPREDAIVNSIASALALVDGGESPLLQLLPKQHFSDSAQSPLGSQSNLWVAETTVIPSAADSPPTTALEVEFVSQASTSSDLPALTGAHFDTRLAELSASFRKKFRAQFPSAPWVAGTTSSQLNLETKEAMSRSVLSNLLGGIGYFYGSSLVRSPLLGPEPVEYWPASLFSATPSRQQFPRGFLWDEGFHGLLLATWDVELALQSLSHWLDLMNAQGWIPREQILGWEARSRVSDEFVVQSTAVANPPTLILVIDRLMQRYPSMVPSEKEIFSKWATTAFPRLHSWFLWFNTTQTGSLPTTYRWRGRLVDNHLQLNPLTLSSGLDDYPRASHPTADERHIDLRCWMAFFARSLAQLGNFVVTVNSGTAQPKLPPGVLEAAHWRHAYTAWADILTDPALLDNLHWSNEHGFFADYGFHTDSIRLIRPPKPPPTNGQHGNEPPRKQRKVLSEPQYRLITSAFGYVSVFPLLLRLLPPDSPRLATLVEKLGRSDLLFTPYGLRSLASNSSYYWVENAEHSPPYWRGTIWVNLNYLALQSFQHYAHHPQTPAAVALSCGKLAQQLSEALVNTVLGNFKRTGFLWEQYNDRTGEGQRAHPFAGWTALVSLIMRDESDLT